MSGRVLITPRSFASTTDEPLGLLRGAGCEVVYLERPADGRLSEAFMGAAVRDVEAVIVGVEPLGAAVIAQSARLRVISKYGVGMDNIDVEAARARGVVVGWTPDANGNAVAELTLGLMFALARRIPLAMNAVRGGQFPRLSGIELRGRTLGVIGLGRIGRRVAKAASAIGMRVIACDPHREPGAAEGVELAEFETLLARSDVVSLHLPLTAESAGLIGEQALSRMRAGALLINTARGGLVDEEALYRALRAGHLGGAAIDCFAHEPPGAGPLLELDTLIATPHMASHTDEAITEMSRMAAENVVAGLRGEPLPYPYPDRE